MLKLKDVHASYGQIAVLHGVSLEVAQGQIVTVLGANGAGKSTTIRTIAGLIANASGTIEFEGRQILGLSTDQIVQLGISVVPEGRQLFGNLTVRDNLKLGAYTRNDGAEVRRQMERVLSYFPVLSDRINLLSYLLSGGEQQMLAIGRALMARPRLLILDEPSLGLAPVLVEEMFTMIKNLSDAENIAVLLAEQNANQAVGIANHGYVLEVGKVVLEDSAKNLLGSEMVRRAYLGF